MTEQVLKIIDQKYDKNTYKITYTYGTEIRIRSMFKNEYNENYIKVQEGEIYVWNNYDESFNHILLSDLGLILDVMFN